MLFLLQGGARRLILMIGSRLLEPTRVNTPQRHSNVDSACAAHVRVISIKDVCAVKFTCAAHARVISIKAGCAVEVIGVVGGCCRAGGQAQCALVGGVSL